MKQLNQHFKAFLSHDKLRPQLCKLHLDGEHVVATDGYVLAFSPSNQFDLTDIQPVEKFPKWRDLVNHKAVKQFQIPLGFIHEQIAKASKVKMPEMAKCTDCDGQGLITCYHCNHPHDCDKCSGDGEIVVGISHEILQIERCHLYSIKEVKFQAPIILSIFALADYLELPIGILVLAETSANLWKVGDVTLIVMPCPVTHYDDEPTAIKIVEL
jgi:hypothetical protein